MASLRTIDWTGAGATAFAIGAALNRPALIRRVAGMDDFLGRAPVLDGPARVLLEQHFTSGGKECSVLFDSRFSEPDWVGDDAGPGARSGIHALSELDEVGMIVLSGASTALREERIRAAASRHPEVLFLFEGVEAAGAPISFAGANAAIVAPGMVPLGALAGHLEEADFSDDVPYYRKALHPPQGLGREDCLRLYAWRRRAGLRRSVDMGTRWIVFEVSHPHLWSGIEREVSAFLAQLRRRGFFHELSPEDGEGFEFDVTCEPAAPEEGRRADASQLVVSLRARLARAAG